MTGKRRIALAAVVIVLFVAAYAGSPFLAAYRLLASARSGDVDALEESVDFPAVRDNLKSEMTAQMASKMTDDPAMKDNPFAALGAMVIPVMIDKMVNAYVTPAGISLIIQKGKKPDGTEMIGGDGGLTSNYDFISLDRFRAKISKNGTESNFLGLIFERRGFFSWKLIRVTFPSGLVETAPAEKIASAPPPVLPVETTLQPASPSLPYVQPPLSATEAAFQDYPSIGLTGTFEMPELRGDAKHMMFRTRLIDAAKSGVNFAGHLALTQIGCGTQCNYATLIDGKTGKIIDFPIGGEEYLEMSLYYHADSNLIKAYWNPDEGKQPTCEHADFVWEETQFRRLPTDGKRALCPA